MSDTTDRRAGAPCNIGPRGVRQRATAGLVALFGGLALGAWSVLAPAGWVPRALSVVLVLFGALALLQARAKT